jgi:hypothetical protein
MFPVRYELNLYMFCRINSVFKGLKSSFPPRTPWDEGKSKHVPVLDYHCGMKTDESVKGQLLPFLSLALHRCDRSALLPSRFSSGEIAPGTA